MKTYLFAVSMVLLTVWSSCKKETKTVIQSPTATLAGEWYGMYGNTPASLPNQPYYFKIRSNFTMKVAGYDSSTVWVADSAYFVLPGDSIKCTYTYRNASGVSGGTYSIAAKYNKNFAFMSGTWGSGKNAYNGGSFYMGRKQE